MRIESNTIKNLLRGVGILLLGVLFLYLTRGTVDVSRDHQAASLLGLFLLLLGAALVILNERVVVVSGERKDLTVRRSSLRSRETRVIPFAGVRSVNVVKLGRTHKGTASYHMNITLKTGERISTGRSSRVGDEINAIAREFPDLVGCATQDAPTSHPIDGTHLLVSLAGAVVIYLAWYRFAVGPWCRAMWFGTAPPVIILAGFAALLIGWRRRKT
jgi:hypothetical protein